MVAAASPSRILHRRLQEERNDQDETALELGLDKNEFIRNDLVRRDLAATREEDNDNDDDKEQHDVE